MALKKTIVTVEARHAWRVPLVYDDQIIDPLALAAEAVMALKDPRILDDGNEEVRGVVGIEPDLYDLYDLKDVEEVGWLTVAEILEQTGHEPADFMIFDETETGLKCLDCGVYFGETQGWHPDFICLECGSPNIGPAVKP